MTTVLFVASRKTDATPKAGVVNISADPPTNGLHYVKTAHLEYVLLPVPVETGFQQKLEAAKWTLVKKVKFETYDELVHAVTPLLDTASADDKSIVLSHLAEVFVGNCTVHGPSGPKFNQASVIIDAGVPKDPVVAPFTQANRIDDMERKYVNKRAKESLGAKKRIGIVFSGGGCRAAHCTRSVYEILKQNKPLYSQVLYVSALSGSTWGTCDTFFHQSINKEDDLTKPYPWTKEAGVIWELMNGFKEVKGVKKTSRVNDFWEEVLHKAYFGENTPPQKIRLSGFREPFSKNFKDYPWPLMSAVEAPPPGVTKKPDWYEFSLSRVTRVGYENGEALDTSAFGYKVNEQGLALADPSGETGARDHLGQLFSIWGSAMMITWGEATDYSKLAGTVPAPLDTLLSAYAKATVKPEDANKPLFQPAVIPSWMKSLPEKTVGLRDAGHVANLPLLPLLEKSRNLDVIIVFDFSGDSDVHLGNELEKAVEHAKGFPSVFQPKYTPDKKKRISTFDFDRTGVSNTPGKIIYLNPGLCSSSCATIFKLSPQAQQLIDKSIKQVWTDALNDATVQGILQI